MSEQEQQDKTARYKKRMQRKKEHIDQAVAEATEERGILIVITGNGKGKSTSGFGTLLRAVGHGFKAGLVQFIKGTLPCGARDMLEKMGDVEVSVMATGFTWETQDKAKDTAAAQRVWADARRMLADPSVRVVMLDELTYVVRYGYINETEVRDAIAQRPAMQSVIITGRGCPKALLEAADTISEIEDVRHAFRAGVKAQAGIDW